MKEDTKPTTINGCQCSHSILYFIFTAVNDRLVMVNISRCYKQTLGIIFTTNNTVTGHYYFTYLNNTSLLYRLILFAVVAWPIQLDELH